MWQTCLHSAVPKRLTDEQRGPLAAWIVRQREARGWKSEEMPGRLADVGYGVRADYYRQVEAGKKPGPDFLASLERLFGAEYVEPRPDAEDRPAPASDLSALASVVERQQSQIADLIGVVTQQQSQIAELLEAVRLLTRPAALVALSDTLASTLQDDESAALAHGRLGAVPAAEAPRPTVLPDAERRGEAP